MDIKIIFAAISSFIAVYAVAFYMYDVRKGNTKPHLYTWLIWTITMTTTSLGMWVSGAGWGVLPIAITVPIYFFIALSSIKIGTRYITTFDTICLVLALIAFVSYLTTKNALLSVGLATFADAIAYVPTMRKSYVEPDSEPPFFYVIYIVLWIFAIAALLEYNTTNLMYPIVLSLCNIVTIAIILVRGKKKKGSSCRE